MSRTSGKTSRKKKRGAALVTGFPSLVARTMVEKLVKGGRLGRVYMLAMERYQEQADRFMARLPDAERERVFVLTGDTLNMDLGLSGQELRVLTAEVTEIFHFAGIYQLSTELKLARKLNVEGTREVLRLASECRALTRLNHYSSAFVSGGRKGVILEEELEAGQRFRNPFERTRFEAERLVISWHDRLPISIYRPSIVMGNSKTGEVDSISGPYYLILLIMMMPQALRVPLPGKGNAPLNMVPVDFVVDAIHHISAEPGGAGLTFHLTDPNPLPARKVFEIVAAEARRKPPRGRLPTGLARLLMKMPGIERITRTPRHFLEYFDHPVIYRCTNTLGLLQGTRTSCPPFESYAKNLLTFIKERGIGLSEQLVPVGDWALVNLVGDEID